MFIELDLKYWFSDRLSATLQFPHEFFMLDSATAQSMVPKDGAPWKHLEAGHSHSSERNPGEFGHLKQPQIHES